MSSNNFYQKVSQLDLNELTEFIDHNQTELIIKINQKFVKTNVNQVKNAKYFSVFKFNEFEFSNEPIICFFRCKEEIYFFHSFLNSSKLEYLIDLPENIFQLQRRNDFRVSLPIGTPHECVINYVNGLQKNIRIEVRDLSLGGCQLSLPAFKLELKKEDIFDINLKIDRFEFSQINLSARHVKMIKEQDCLLVGASYIDLDGENLSDMRALLMFLDRKARGKAED